MKKVLKVLFFVGLTALLAVTFPWAVTHFTLEAKAPPGIHVPDARVLTVWVLGDDISGMGFLRNRSAAFEKANPGLRVYLRMADAAELTAADAVLPDVLVLGPGDVTAPETLLTPLVEDSLLSGALRAGRWQDRQYALPFAISGYVLAVDNAVIPATDIQQAPIPSLWDDQFRAPDTQEDTPITPNVLPWDALAASFTPRTQQGKRKIAATYALQAPGGTPLMLLATLSESRQSTLDAPALPEDFMACTPKKAYSDFTAKSAHGVMLTLPQWRSFQALVSAGKGFAAQAYVPTFAFTDLYLAAGVIKASKKPETALAFVKHLVSIDGQTALGKYGLLSVLPGMHLYGSDTPTLYQMEQLYGTDVFLPNLYTYSKEQMESIAFSAWHQGGDMYALIERML